MSAVILAVNRAASCQRGGTSGWRLIDAVSGRRTARSQNIMIRSIGIGKSRLPQDRVWAGAASILGELK